MNEHERERAREVFDGKKMWEAKDFGSDADRFFVEVVRPLRNLERRGLFEGKYEYEFALQGAVKILGFEITGPINYEFKIEDGP